MGILVVDRNKIYCHKMILVMHSDFFKAMFKSEMKEAKSDEIEIKNVELEVIKNVIFFMYTGKIDYEKINISLLIAADMYAVMDLRSICIEILSKTINSINVEETWQAGILLNIEDLVDATTVFMVKNWAKLSK